MIGAGRLSGWVDSVRQLLLGWDYQMTWRFAMPATEPRRSPEEVARLGTEVYDRRVRPSLRPEDDGKFVAIDVDTGEYEIDEDDYTAVMRLEARKPAAEVWLMCAGRRATCRIGWRGTWRSVKITPLP
jgi:hypothetical protein